MLYHHLWLVNRNTTQWGRLEFGLTPPESSDRQKLISKKKEERNKETSIVSARA